MNKALLFLRLGIALCLVLPASCVTSPGTATDELHPRRRPRAVKVSELPGGRFQLAFQPAAPDAPLEGPRMEEVRAVLAALHASFPHEEGRRLRLVRTSTEPEPAEWERRLREEFVSAMALPSSPCPAPWR